MKMINASGKVGIYMMTNLFQRALDKKECQKIGRLVWWCQATSEKETNCRSYREVMLLEYGIKVIERVLEKKDKSIGVDR